MLLPVAPVSEPNPAVFLDLDGTLVEIAAHPELIDVSRELIDALGRAHARLGGALAIISGRSLADLDRQLAPLRLPAAGIHGLEHRDARGEVSHPAGEGGLPDEARARLSALADAVPGLLIEDKGNSVAVHYRQVPAAAERVRSALAAIRDGLARDFIVQAGKMVAELRPAGATKGTAILAFMAEPPFAGRRPVFIGDDVTDEDGFAAVNSLGGQSVRVGPAQAPTAARYQLPDVAAVHDWLDRIGNGGRRQRA